MRRMLVMLVAALLVGTAVYGQGGLGIAIEPGLEYQVFVPTNPDAEAVAKPVGQVPLTFIIPASADGCHNIRLIGGGVFGQDYTGAHFGAGYAYVPAVNPNILVGLVLKMGLTFPGNEEFACDMMGEGSEETWFDVGAEANFDFQAPMFSMPASLIVGVSAGLRDAPNQVHVGLRVPMIPVSVATRTHRL